MSNPVDEINDTHNKMTRSLKIMGDKWSFMGKTVIKGKIERK